MRELDVGHNRTVPVLPGDRSNIHAYSYSTYYEHCQAYN
jgi:hypothetical protein